MCFLYCIPSGPHFCFFIHLSNEQRTSTEQGVTQQLTCQPTPSLVLIVTPLTSDGVYRVSSGLNLNYFKSQVKYRDFILGAAS